MECECVQEKYYLFVLFYDVLEQNNRKAEADRQSEAIKWAGHTNNVVCIAKQVSPLM
jgi:hypothetical protein